MSANLPPAFSELLGRTGMVFEPPAQSRPVEPKSNQHILIHHALALDPGLEIRYQVVDWEGRQADEQLKTTMLLAVIANAALRVLSKPMPLHPGMLRENYGADWGFICKLQPKVDAFGSGFSACTLAAISLSKRATGYLFFMQASPAAELLIERNLYALRFKEGIPPNPIMFLLHKLMGLTDEEKILAVASQNRYSVEELVPDRGLKKLPQ